MTSALVERESELTAAISPPSPAPDSMLLGHSQAMRRVYHMIARVASTQATVLLAGESGTGKELVADTIHQRSRRRHMPMIALNCGAVPETLIESELFGHEKGAFTGAQRMRTGVFERAGGGTLFLDEVTEMPMPLQVRLLRVLESGCLTRVGGELEVPIDVRVIASTNRDPRQAVEDHLLRKDLLYRLAIFPIYLPPLRERGDDVVLLAEHFLSQHNQEEGTAKRFAPAVRSQLCGFTWPGNVRQLNNAVYQAFIMADEVIELEHLPRTLWDAADTDTADSIRVSPGTPIADVERRLIEATLGHFDGDKKQTSQSLGISLKTLYNRLHAYEASEKPDVVPL